MKHNYSIDEILMAVNKIHNKKKVKKLNPQDNKQKEKNYSAVPKDKIV